MTSLQFRKPSTSEPPSPSSEEENAVPMPRSGAASPFFNSIEHRYAVGRARIECADRLAHRLDGIKSPQKVPSNPRNTNRPTR